MTADQPKEPIEQTMLNIPRATRPAHRAEPSEAVDPETDFVFDPDALIPPYDPTTPTGWPADWTPNFSANEQPEPEVVEQPVPPILLVVVGSFAWTNRGAVMDAMVELWHAHNDHPFQVVTSGCPAGAELVARDMARDFGWVSTILRDEELDQLPSALVLGFVKDDSRGASALLLRLAGKFWSRTYTERTTRQVSEWAHR